MADDICRSIHRSFVGTLAGIFIGRQTAGGTIAMFKNVGSTIRDRAEIMNEDARRKEVEAYLRKSFDPAGSTLQRVGEQRYAYQKPLVFPTIEDIRAALGAHATLLIISQPSHARLNPELKAFWTNKTWRNRLMFLCGSETFTEVSWAAAYMRGGAGSGQGVH